MFELVTGTDMKPWLTRNMLLNINTCENGWSNFSANLTVVSLKLLKLTQFAWPNLSIYFNFLCAVPRYDVIESTRFLMRPPVNNSTMSHTFLHGHIFCNTVPVYQRLTRSTATFSAILYQCISVWHGALPHFLSHCTSVPGLTRCNLHNSSCSKQWLHIITPTVQIPHLS